MNPDDLNKLAVEAAAVDADVAPVSPSVDAGVAQASEPGAVPAVSEVQALTAALHIARGILSPAFSKFPSLKAIYTDETLSAIAEATAPVLEKYGCSVSGLLERWAVELACASTVGAIGYASYIAIQDDIAAQKKSALPGENPPAEKIEAPVAERG